MIRVVAARGGARARVPLAAALALAFAAPAAAAPAPARVQASADEFSLVLSRASLRAGPVIVQLVNYGEDDHDLALQRPGGPRKRVGTVHPGAVGELETTHRPGRDVVWCTLADHRARGMQTTLVVRAR